MVQRCRSYQKYCIDADFLQTLTRDKVNTFGQNTIEYVLKTGANWSGPIKEFRLLVDKGSPDNLVSFCGQNVQKIGPTQFEMTKRNFTPTANLAILILKREAPIGPAPPQVRLHLKPIFLNWAQKAAMIFGTSETPYSRQRDIVLNYLVQFRPLGTQDVNSMMKPMCLYRTSSVSSSIKSGVRKPQKGVRNRWEDDYGFDPHKITKFKGTKAASRHICRPDMPSHREHMRKLLLAMTVLASTVVPTKADVNVQCQMGNTCIFQTVLSRNF